MSLWDTNCIIWMKVCKLRGESIGTVLCVLRREQCAMWPNIACTCTGWCPLASKEGGQCAIRIRTVGPGKKTEWRLSGICYGFVVIYYFFTVNAKKYNFLIVFPSFLKKQNTQNKTIQRRKIVRFLKMNLFNNLYYVKL